MDMAIEQYLLKHQEEISRKWFDLLTSNYSPESARLFKKESDQFANPVGQTFLAAVDQILGEFLGENRAEALTPMLDRIIRVRAVQSFSPSTALGFVFGLKTIAEEVLAEELAEGDVGMADLRGFERKVEGLGLLAFDIYVRCRETLFDIKVAEIKNNTRRLLERAQLIIGEE